MSRRRSSAAAMTFGLALAVLAAPALRAQQMVTETRDPAQMQDPDFAKAYAEWTSDSIYGSPLVDHLPLVKGIPTPKDVLGYYIGAPGTLTYYADIVKYYRALAKATPRVKVETIGRSDEGRELVVVWVSSEENIRNLQHNRDNLAKLADPRGLSQAQINELIATTKPHYHLIGGLHSGETGPSEMLMELVYRLATETSPLIERIRNNVIVSVTPAAEPDGRDRNVDWFYHGLDMQKEYPATQDTARDAGRGAGPGGAGGAGGGGGAFGRGGSVEGQLPYWGKYVYHDNNRDINLSMVEMRAITDWYYTAHPPIIHDLHESESLMYTYSGGPPQNPNLDPILFAELPWFSNWELAQMTKYGMPGVYTHAFMDGWSPGYLGSVAYNHNGMMRMYETQSGRDKPAPSTTLAGGGRDSSAVARPAAAESTAATGERVGRGGRGGRGAPAGRGARGAAPGAAAEAPGAGRGGRGAPGEGRGVEIPTGKGGGQPREWYRGLPIPPNAIQNFTRRNNTNYMETGVLSALQLTAMFPNVILQNFYIKTKHSLDDGSTKAPYGFVLTKTPDMTRAATLVNILRAQGIEVGTLEKTTIAGTDTFPAGSYVVKLNQPYGRLAKNLLERQDYPDPALMTYDDSGWSMGYAFDIPVKEINEKSILEAPVTPITTAVVRGTVTGSGSAGLAVAHYGSNNMITFRYRLKNVQMKIAEAAFTVDGVSFPAGSFIVAGSSSEMRHARELVDSLGLTAAALSSAPAVKTHDANVPRVAIYSQWNGTQDLGWYRYTFDRFGVPYDLIYKERLEKGDLKKDYDVILMAAQNINRSAVLAPKAKHPQPYERSDKYKFLGMYGSTPDMSGGFGAAGVDAINAFLDAGGTLITAAQAIHYPIDFGLARSVEAEEPQGVNAQKPLIMAKITRRDSPVFYGYDSTDFPLKFGQGSQIFHVGVADQPDVIAEYVGGDSSVLSGLMVGADHLKDAAFAVDIPQAHNGHGRVLMFANNPIYRWQNHGEFNMVFNSILNWDDVPPAPPLTAPVAATGRGRGGQR